MVDLYLKIAQVPTPLSQYFKTFDVVLTHWHLNVSIILWSQHSIH